MEESPHSALVAAFPLRPRPTDSPVPLTPIQRGSWDYLVERDRLSARMCVSAVRLLGPLDTSVLQTSFETLIRRHESLRTRIVLEAGVPRQQIDPAQEYCLPQIDLSCLTSTRAEAEAAQLAQAFLEEKIDLSIGPLFAARLLRLSDSDHVLIILLDHIVSDAASYEVLNRELWTLYRQMAQGSRPSLPLLPVQFADYAVWHEGMRRYWQTHQAYWQLRIADAPLVQVPTATDPGNTLDSTSVLNY